MLSLKSPGRSILTRCATSNYKSLIYYSIAIGSCLLAFLIKVVLLPVIGLEHTFLLFFAAVMISSWIGGLGPGLVATVLATILNAYFFMSPFFSFAIGIHDLLRLFIFVLVSLMTNSLNSARKRTEEERTKLLIQALEAQQKAEDATRSKDQFLAVVSHEMRTPLTAILGWVRLLQTGKLDQESTKNALKVIERNVKLQTILIEELLDISRIVTGKFWLEKKPIDLFAIIEDSIEALQPTANEKSIKIEIQSVSSVELVLGDSAKLQQIFWNLITNSIKFTPKYGSIFVIVNKKSPYIEIKVKDSGDGIEPAFLPYVFETFKQDESARRHGGLGLGLAIVRHIVELHEGTIEVESEGRGKGTTFTIRLPIIATNIEIKSFEEVALEDNKILS